MFQIIKGVFNRKNKIYLKIHSKSGESISETLVALLISALALVMLAGAVGASSRIVTNSRNRINEYYDANQNSDGIVMMSGSGNTGALTVTDITDKNNQKQLVVNKSVKCYINDSLRKPVISFKE
ncbi:MAG: hypothetical protein IJH95_03930 [Mogibacterium sp.]|nr:hypothetical protein [Mogibacterium sp.]